MSESLNLIFSVSESFSFRLNPEIFVTRIFHDRVPNLRTPTGRLQRTLILIAPQSTSAFHMPCSTSHPFMDTQSDFLTSSLHCREYESMRGNLRPLLKYGPLKTMIVLIWTLTNTDVFFCFPTSWKQQVCFRTIWKNTPGAASSGALQPERILLRKQIK